MWVWMSMTGNLDRATIVSCTRNMLFGAYSEISKGLRCGIASSAEPETLSSSGFAATPASKPIVYSHLRRSIMLFSPTYEIVKCKSSRTTRRRKRSQIFRFRREAPAELLRSPRAIMPSINFYFLSFSFSMFYFLQAIAGPSVFIFRQGVKGVQRRPYHRPYSKVCREFVRGPQCVPFLDVVTGCDGCTVGFGDRASGRNPRRSGESRNGDHNFPTI